MMSYCPNCGRQILDESLGCPVCNVKNNTTGTASAKAEEEKAEKVEEFTVEDNDGKTHHFETNEETGDAEYQRKATVAEDAKIHPLLKVLIIVMIVMVGGFGAIAGCVAGLVLSKSPSEDYRRFGKLMMTVSIVMLVISFLCCVVGMGFSLFTGGSITHHVISEPVISY